MADNAFADPAGDPKEAGSPAWWIARLDKRLRDRADDVAHLHAYYEGIHRLKFATSKFIERFGPVLQHLSDNWTALVVDAVAERLRVNGFRIGTETSADKAAWEIWQRNAMDSEWKLGLTEALIAREAFVTVWADEQERALITMDSPAQMIVDTEPGRRRVRRAAWKSYRDDYSGHLFGVLYLPDAIYKFRSTSPVEANRAARDSVRWEVRSTPGEDWPLANPLKVVPVIPLRNRPKLLQPASSEIRSTIPLQDACNKLLGDLLIASEFQSFRQRWATGFEIPTDPETEQPVETFKAAIERLWISEDAETKFGEFGQVDLAGYIAAIELVVQHVASQSRTPPHYFYLKGNLPSGESIKSAETGLVAKSREKMLFYGEDLEEVMRLALRVESEDGRAAAEMAETIWDDPEYRTEGEHVDAMTKLKALGLPDEFIWEKLGLTQAEIERAKAIKRENALTLAAATIPPRPTLVAPTPAPSNGGPVPAEAVT
jgi:hypothetical protein